MLENIYLIGTALGILISISLMLQAFAIKKANFFIGLITLILSFELLFSWAAHSGYNNMQGHFPIPILLNYLVIPPSIWYFAQYHQDDNFSFRSLHLLLYLPAIILTSIELYALFTDFRPSNYAFWPILIDYLPLFGSMAALTHFWVTFVKRSKAKKSTKTWLVHIRVVSMMAALSLISLMWLLFSFIGWQQFYLVELILVTLFFGLSLLNFLENTSFIAPIQKAERNAGFPHYDDQQQLRNLEKTMEEQRLYLTPNLPLKEVAANLGLPQRYISYLINQYHHRNYKEFVNEYRIATFLKKAQSGQEDHKTLLALALESGFSSKSTFNQVFKNRHGKSPSEYLAASG